MKNFFNTIYCGIADYFSFLGKAFKDTWENSPRATIFIGCLTVGLLVLGFYVGGWAVVLQQVVLGTIAGFIGSLFDYADYRARVIKEAQATNSAMDLTMMSLLVEIEKALSKPVTGEPVDC